MLVINRRTGEDIDVYDPQGNLVMVIRLCEVKGSQSKIGFICPRAITLKRALKKRSKTEDNDLEKHWDMKKSPTQDE